ncbi:sigma 54-interacting transcriptional regulator, partial [Myxococcota bacterium]|nr:sigma 54-interacting transcriptional regulator [Myxococcota bacterium]
ITLDLSTLPVDLIPAHLFGVTRGAYTGAVADRKGAFELADGGTLFIDEIQNASLEIQKRLLLVLQDRRVRPLGSHQERAVDVKVIVASSRPLAEEVAAGRFRPDLFMRLSPATRITLPPLRARPTDLLFLARRFVARAGDDLDVEPLRVAICAALGLPPSPLALAERGEAARPEALCLIAPPVVMARLMAHPWPGNLRELAMVMHNLVLFTLVGALDAIEEGLRLSGPRFQIDLGLVEGLLAGGLMASKAATEDAGLLKVKIAPRETLNQVSSEVERQYLVQLFEAAEGDFSEMAARLLGDPGRARAVRLRFNQLGLKVRDLRGR